MAKVCTNAVWGPTREKVVVERWYIGLNTSGRLDSIEEEDENMVVFGLGVGIESD